MVFPDLQELERRARRRYEVARARRALVGAAPALALLFVLAIGAIDRLLLVGLALSLYVCLAMLLWVGRDAARAVLPGLAAGLVPLVFSLVAHTISHDCAGWTCLVCIPMCASGGLIAGAAVSWLGLRLRFGAVYWAAASLLVLLVGAMGCACVGVSGVVGLLLGLVVGAAPGVLRSRHVPQG